MSWGFYNEMVLLNRNNLGAQDSLGPKGPFEPAVQLLPKMKEENYNKPEKYYRKCEQTELCIPQDWVKEITDSADFHGEPS